MIQLRGAKQYKEKVIVFECCDTTKWYNGDRRQIKADESSKQEQGQDV